MKLALIVDGDPIIRLVTSHVCEELGLAVETAGDAVSCFQRLSARGAEFSLVLMDPDLPCRFGCGTVETIRTLPAARPGRLPIVAVGGGAGTALPAAYDAVIGRPAVISDLQRVLAELNLA